MTGYPTHRLLREWVASSDVKRVPGDDDGISNVALVRPTTALTEAVAEVLLDAGFIRPHGVGVYQVTWSADATDT